MPQIGRFEVSRQGYGAMGLSSAYGQADDAESIRTLHRAIDLGITHFDTATGYGAGHNERLLGQAIRDRRDGLVLASKFVHHPGGSEPQDPLVQPRQAVEATFNVRVTGVNTINRQGKRRRTRFGWGKRPDTKRAIVSLAAGERIDLFGGPVS